MNSGLNEHFLFVTPTLLLCYSHLVDFFSIPSNHHNFLLKSYQLSCDPFLEKHIYISSTDVPTKFAPLSDLIIPTIPLCPMKRLKLKIKESVLNE